MALPMIAIQLGITGGMFLLNRHVLNEDAKLPKPRPEGVEFPQTATGTPVSIVYGTMRIDAPLIVWTGNEGSRWDEFADAYAYQLDMLLVLGTPFWDAVAAPWSSWRAAYPPTLMALWYGGIRQRLGIYGAGRTHDAAPSVGGDAVEIDLGAYGPAGSFLAFVGYFDGRSDQAITLHPAASTNSYRIDRAIDADGVALRSEVPGYRHQMLMSIVTSDRAGTTNGSIGPTSRVEAIAAEVRVVGPDPVTDTLGAIEANPAWAIYDLIFGGVWKIGIPTARADLASFTAAATALLAEGHGCSVVVQTGEPIATVLMGLLDQINGVMYEDPATGLIALRLIRADYDPMTIPELNRGNTIGEPEITIVGWAEVANQVEIAFTDRDNDYKRGTATAQRLANAAGQDGRVRSRRIEYPGVCNIALANTLATRELAIASRPITVVQATVERSLFALTYGDAVRVNWTGALTGKNFRVLDIDYGQLADGAIRLSLVEDIFTESAGAGVDPQPVVPTPYLLPIYDRLATEAPRWMTGRLAAQSVIADADTYRTLALAANRYDVSARAFQTQAPNPFASALWIRDVPGDAGFVLWGTLAAIYPRTAEPYDTGVGLQITASTELATSLLFLSISPEPSIGQIQAGERLCVIYDRATGAHEFISFAAHVIGGAGSHTLQKVWRGLLDTAPRDWPIGSTIVYLATGYGGNVGRVGLLEGSASVRWQPYGAASGTDVRVTDTLTVIGRPVLPLPAQDFGVTGNEAEGTVGQGGSGYLKEVTDLDGSLDTDGRPRSRTLGVITRGTSADQGVEAGTTWALVGQRMAAHGFALEEDEIVIVDGLTSPTTTGVLLGGVGHGSIDLKLRTVNGAFESFTDPTIRVEAPSFRNLLRNGNGAELDVFANPAAWSNDADTFVAQGGTAPRQWLVIGSVFIPGVTPIFNEGVHSQTVDVSGFPAPGLTAVLTWQHQATTVASSMQYTVDLVPLDAAGAVLAGTATTGVATSQATLFKTTEISIATLPALTAQLKVRISAISYDDVFAFTEIRLIVGQQGAQLLTNPTFDT